MSKLYLHCELCGRKQAEGLLSRAAWGHVELTDGRTVSACSPCRTADADWEARLRALGGVVLERRSPITQATASTG